MTAKLLVRLAADKRRDPSSCNNHVACIARLSTNLRPAEIHALTGPTTNATIAQRLGTANGEHIESLKAAVHIS